MSSKKVINSFIVKIYKYNGQKFEYYGDGQVKILKDDANNYLQLHDTKENTLLCENNILKDNMRFSFRKACQTIVSFDDRMYGIEFDKNSHASFSNFEKTIRKIIGTRVKEVYYKSGNPKLTGEFSDGQFNGECIEFYDSIKPLIKYKGEFEDGLYDGEGEFKSKDGLIRLHCNNISQGTPIDYGKLFVKDVGEYDIDFSKITEKYYIDLSSNNLCYECAEVVVPNLKEKLFKNLAVDDKFDFLLEKIRELSTKVDKLENKKGLGFW